MSFLLYFKLMILGQPLCLLGQTFEQVDSTLTERVRTGSDSLQIILITRPTMTYNKDLTIIAKSKDGWYGESYMFDKRNEKKEATKIFNLTNKYTLQPKKNWETFIEELYKLNVLNLTSKELLMLDGTEYTFQIITQNSRREYKYNAYGKKPMDDAEKIIRAIQGELKQKRVK